jgi:DoxX-like family
MKKDNIIYWLTTGVISLMMVFSAFMYLTSPEIEVAFQHLGFPSFFRVELAWAKVVAAAILIIPFIPVRVKEWAYAGLGIVFVSATIAHIVNGDAVSVVISPVIFLGILVISNIYLHKRIGSNGLKNVY